MTLRDCLNTNALPPALDMYVCEYASQTLFWDLSVFIGVCLIFYIIQDESHVRFGRALPDPEQQAELDQYLPYRRAAPAFMRRLRPHVNSGPRKAAVVLVYLVGLVLQCIETYWVFATWWRLVWKYTLARSEVLAREHMSLPLQLLTGFPIVLWVTFGTTFTLICVYVVGCQVSSLREIIAIDPASPATTGHILAKFNTPSGTQEDAGLLLKGEK